MWLVRELALRSEFGLIRDIGISEFSAVGLLQFDAEYLETSRFTFNFDFTSIREAETRLNRSNVYASPCEELLDQFRLAE